VLELEKVFLYTTVTLTKKVIVA